MLRKLGFLLALLFCMQQAHATSSTLGNLSSGSAIATTDLFYDVQSTGTGGVKVTGTQLVTFMQAQLECGSSTNVCFNSSSSFGGNSGLTYDGSATLNVGTSGNSQYQINGSNVIFSNSVAYTCINTNSFTQNNGLCFETASGNVLLGRADLVFGWGSNPGDGTSKDTGLSRDSAAVVDVGNGTAADTSGTIKAAHATLTTLANSATTSAVCYNTGTGVLTYDATVGTCTTSTMRVKHDIVSLDNAAMLNGVLRMRPVSFEYNDEVRTPGLQLGLIAEDMAAIDPNLVAYDAEGKPVAIKFLGPVVAYLVGALKAQQAEIAELKRKVH